MSEITIDAARHYLAAMDSVHLINNLLAKPSLTEIGRAHV